MNKLTADYLQFYCSQGMADAEIGKIFGMTGEGVAYRRKKIGIFTSDKYNRKRELIKEFKGIDTSILQEDYYKYSQKDFSLKYNLSKTVWRPILKERGITLKSIHRVESYPPFNISQISLIIGSLLGDGSVSQGDFYYESHSLKQELYIKKKWGILNPYSRDIYYCDNHRGLRFKTVSHPNFKEFYNKFYNKDIKGKLIPVDFIKDNWRDDILSYWFFDDGYYDKKRNELTIANKCPDYDMLVEFVSFLEEHFKWRFSIWKRSGLYFVTFSKRFYKNFSELLIKTATPDLYYKIP